MTNLFVVPVCFTVEGDISAQDADRLIAMLTGRASGVCDIHDVDGKSVEVTARMADDPTVFGADWNEPIITIAEYAITDEFISDIVVTACEGGSAGLPSWALGGLDDRQSYAPDRWLDFDGDMGVREGVIQQGFVFAEVVDRETYEPFEDWDGKITPELIRRGLARWARHDVSHGHDTMAGMIPRRTIADLMEDHDATDADNIVQLGAFGEIRFG